MTTDTTDTTDTTLDSTIDEQTAQAFAGHVMDLYTGGLLTYLIDLGQRTGLFDAAAQGPGTSAEIADRAGLHERYVREWLGAMVTGGIIDYAAAGATYRLPPEHAVCLAGDGPLNLAPLSQLNTYLAKYVGDIATAFREGGGVPYSAFRPEFTAVMDALSRPFYDGLLVDAVLPLAPGLTERLIAGARVADVGCGSGHALVVLAQAFPRSTFVGFDLDEEAIDRARREAADLGLGNVTFEVRDATTVPSDPPFDAVLVFDALHDQVDPHGMLRAIHDALVPGGVFLAKEPHVSSRLEDNVGNPFAPFIYSISTMHCLTVSLAHDGAGLGTAFGEQVARQLLSDAGFGDITVHEAPGDPTDAVYVATKR